MRSHVIAVVVALTASPMPGFAQREPQGAPPAQTGNPPADPSASIPTPTTAAPVQDEEPPPPPAPMPAPPPPPAPMVMQAPPGVYTMCFTDGVQCFTNEAYVWKIGSTAKTIVVPAGFVTDFASIPRGARDLFERQGVYSRAALIHDFLYWSQRCTRAQADNLFYIAMIESNVPWSSRQTILQVVRAGAGPAWRGNAADRAAGLVRVVPAGYETMADGLSWAAARAELKRLGAVDPAFRIDPGVCRIGDATVVP